MTVAEIDLRVGGKWRYVMDASNGQEVGFHGEFRDIVPNERIVQTEAYEGIPDPDESANVNTMTLVEADGRTTMELLIQCVGKESGTCRSPPGWRKGCRSPTTTSRTSPSPSHRASRGSCPILCDPGRRDQPGGPGRGAPAREGHMGSSPRAGGLKRIGPSSSARPGVADASRRSGS
jgi:Activator of Hsp90 ATPase homolog 1-like protein